MGDAECRFGYDQQKTIENINKIAKILPRFIFFDSVEVRMNTLRNGSGHNDFNILIKGYYEISFGYFYKEILSIRKYENLCANNF